MSAPQTVSPMLTWAQLAAEMVRCTTTPESHPSSLVLHSLALAGVEKMRAEVRS